MIGEPDAGKPHVRFDEGVQETCDIAARLRALLYIPSRPRIKPFAYRKPKQWNIDRAEDMECEVFRCAGAQVTIERDKGERGDGKCWKIEARR